LNSRIDLYDSANTSSYSQKNIHTSQGGMTSFYPQSNSPGDRAVKTRNEFKNWFSFGSTVRGQKSNEYPSDYRVSNIASKGKAQNENRFVDNPIEVADRKSFRFADAWNTAVKFASDGYHSFYQQLQGERQGGREREGKEEGERARGGGVKSKRQKEVIGVGL